MIDTKKLEVGCLSLLLSPKCNLQCGYCQLSQRERRQDNTQLWNNTITALQDGTFLNNIVKVLQRLNQPLSRIERIEL